MISYPRERESTSLTLLALIFHFAPAGLPSGRFARWRERLFNDVAKSPVAADESTKSNAVTK